MSDSWPARRLGDVLRHRKHFISIDDRTLYNRCRVQLHAQGIVVRDQVPGSEINTKNQQICRAGDFLVAEIDAKMGGFGIVPPELDGAIVSSHYFLFEVVEDRLDRRFLGWYCKTPAFRAQVRAQGTTNYAAIRPSHVLGYFIPLPPLAEQRRIVARLDALAAKTEEAKGLRTDSDERAARLLSVILNGLERSLRVEASVVRLGALVTQHDSGWSPQCEDTPALADGWGVLKTTCVQWYGFQWRENKALPEALAARPEITVRKGDVLITRAGPVNRVGIACAVPNDQPRLMLSDKIVRLRLQPTATPEYVALCLRFPSVQEQFRHTKTGLAESQVNIPREKLLALEVPLPSRDKQSEAVAFVQGSIGKLESLSRESQAGEARINALLPSLLDRAFAGAL